MAPSVNRLPRRPLVTSMPRAPVDPLRLTEDGLSQVKTASAVVVPSRAKVVLRAVILTTKPRQMPMTEKKVLLDVRLNRSASPLLSEQKHEPNCMMDVVGVVILRARLQLADCSLSSVTRWKRQTAK